MDPIFTLIAMVTLVAASGAMMLRNLVHCALSLVIAFTGFAVLYLRMHAEFAAAAQFLVYVGAVAILLVFALLLTRNSETTGEAVFSPGARIGVGIAGAVAIVLGWAISVSGPLGETPAGPAPTATVKDIGISLMTDYVVALEVIALLLTAAMIGAVIISLREKKEDQA